MQGESKATPLVTIGVTSYNSEKTIERAIRSALAQRWPAIEVLVVDDASTDTSPTILKRLAAEDSRLGVLFRQQNGGVAASRNAIVQNAGGEFIAFFDDDDEGGAAEAAE